jgi:hypothetical protein
MSSWRVNIIDNHTSPSVEERIPILASLEDNIRVTTAQLYADNTQTDSDRAGRIGTFAL